MRLLTYIASICTGPGGDLVLRQFDSFAKHQAVVCNVQHFVFIHTCSCVLRVLNFRKGKNVKDASFFSIWDVHPSFISILHKARLALGCTTYRRKQTA